MSWQLRSAGVASVCALCLAIYVLGRYAHWRIRTYGVEYHANLYLPHTRRILVDTCEIRGVDVFKDPVYAPNHRLHDAVKLFEGVIQGSESVAFSKDGSMVMLDKFGTVFRAASWTRVPERVTHLGVGRPLGSHFDSSDNLLICNPPVPEEVYELTQGLQILEKDSKHPKLLASEAWVNLPNNPPGWSRIRYPNDVTVARNGTVYLTDSSDVDTLLNEGGWYDTARSALMSMLQGGPVGRILRYEPSTGLTTVVAVGFTYPNGIVLSEDESFLLVSETAASRILRVHLIGPKAGKVETFLKTLQLPYHPDGVSRGFDGTFWVAMVAPRLLKTEKLIFYRTTRWLMAWGPSFLKPKILPASAIAQISAEGEILRYLADADGSHISSIASVLQREEGLYFGNLMGDYIGFLSSHLLPPLFPHNSTAAA